MGTTLFAAGAAKTLLGRAAFGGSLGLVRFIVYFVSRRGQGSFAPCGARPKGAALWNPAAFEKAGETFFCAPRAAMEESA